MQHAHPTNAMICTGWLLLCIPGVLLLSSAAQADCLGDWDISGPWEIDQANLATAQFQLTQTGREIGGTASCCGLTGNGNVSGSITGNEITLTVQWNGTYGAEYRGRISDLGWVSGRTWALANPGLREVWSGDRVAFPCKKMGKFCNAYANDAVAQATKNKQMQCGLEKENADRWTTNREAHLDWCLAQEAYADPTTEGLYRIAGLKKCAEEQEASREKLEQEATKGKGALTPGSEVGDVLKQTQPPSPQDKLGIEQGPTIGDFLKNPKQ